MTKAWALLIALLFALPAQAAELQKVTLAHFGQGKFLLYLPLYVAMEEGHFKAEGLDVGLKFPGNDNMSFSLLLSGEADFSIGDPVFAAIAREKGGPGKVVAMMITSLGLTGVTNNPAIADIKDPKQLDGLRVSSFSAPSTTYTQLSEIKRNHKLDKMKIVEAAFGAQIAALEAGSVDIAVDIEPNISVAEAKGYRRVLRVGPFVDRQAITGIQTLDKTIAERPELVQKFVSALQAAVTQMYNDPKISYQVAAKLYPDMDAKVRNHAVDMMLGEKLYPKSIVVDDKLWQRTLQTRLESGELKKPQATTESVDNRFAEAAQKSAHKAHH
ncbi:MAG: ABC transporter substrate-binding protein [Bdellovibrionales bacterium]